MRRVIDLFFSVLSEAMAKPMRTCWYWCRHFVFVFVFCFVAHEISWPVVSIASGSLAEQAKSLHGQSQWEDKGTRSTPSRLWDPDSELSIRRGWQLQDIKALLNRNTSFPSCVWEQRPPDSDSEKHSNLLRHVEPMGFGPGFNCTPRSRLQNFHHF